MGATVKVRCSAWPNSVTIRTQAGMIVRADTERPIGRGRRLRRAHIPGNLLGCGTSSSAWIVRGT